MHMMHTGLCTVVVSSHKVFVRVFVYVLYVLLFFVCEICNTLWFAALTLNLTSKMGVEGEGEDH